LKFPLGLAVSIALVAAPLAAQAQSAGDGYAPPKLLTPGTNSSASAGKGTVTVQVMVKADGSFKVGKVLKSTNPSNDAAALEIAKSSKYKPAYRQGKAVDAFYDYQLTFGGDVAATGGEGMKSALASIKAAKYDDAKTQLNAYLQTHPGDQQAYTLLGVANGFAGDAGAASMAFEKAGPIADQWKSVAIQAYAKYASTQLDQKKFTDVITYAGKALELDPNNLQSYYVRGIAYANTQNDAAAITDLNKAKTIAAANKADDKTMAAIAFNLAVTQFDAGQFGEAATSSKEAVRLDPSKSAQLDKYAFVTVNNAAVALANAGKTADAVARLENGAAQFPTAAGPLMSQAAYIMATEKSPNWKKVGDEADKALAIDPNDGRGNYIRGVSAAQQQDTKAALTYLNKAKASPTYTSDPAFAKQVDDVLKQLNTPAK
jgi:TonB family protein